MFVKASLIGGAAASLFLAPQFVDDITRGAAEGEERTRTIEASREMTVVDMIVSMNGEELPAEMLGDFESTSIDSFSATLHDVFSAADGTRATRFVRSYRELAGNSAMEGGMMEMMGEGDVDRALASELEGEDVIFTWDADAEEYTPSFPEDSDADEELLEDLVGDLEMAELLPEAAVSVGDEWDIDLEHFELIVEPGGEFHLAPEGEEISFDEMEEQIEEADVEPEYEGSLTGKLVSVEGRVATIEITAEIEMLLDLSGVIDPMTQEMEGMELVITPVELVIERTAEGTGTLLWDLDKGRMVSLEFEAEVVEVSTNSVEIEVMGETMEQYQEVTQEGVIQVALSIG